jgi:hypothetical protein
MQTIDIKYARESVAGDTVGIRLGYVLDGIRSATYQTAPAAEPSENACFPIGLVRFVVEIIKA